jgi:hypothetical protein
MDTMLQQVILKNHPNTVIIAIHGALSNYENNDFYPLIDSLHFDADGAANVNQMGEPSNIDDISDTVNARYARSVESPVKIEIISKDYNASNRILTVVAKSTAMQAGMSGQYRINAVILESNLISYQWHFPECPGGDGYNHRNVLRAMKFITNGDNLIKGEWAQQKEISRTFSMELDDKWVPSNCDVVIFVDKANGTLNNSEIQQAVKQGITRPLGIEPNPSASDGILNVFPNPVHGLANIHISIAEDGPVKVDLYDINGRKVKSVSDQKLKAGVFNIEFDASGISSGSYILQMEANKKVYSTKMQIR